VRELYALFEFLQIDLDPKRKRQEDYLKSLLKDHMVRRKKSALQSELQILPCEEKRIILEFSKPERALYDYLERRFYYQLTKIKSSTTNKGAQTANTYTLTYYVRLKQVCSHHNVILDKFPDLIPLARGRGTDDGLSDLEDSSEILTERSYYEEATDYEEATEIIQSY
jgi:hypothetical protein